ncbi:MAG: excalibur calcium-binding domain-containing protein [Hyphomicrobium sp.]
MLRLACAVAVVLDLTSAAGAFDCTEKYCTQMSSCAEAHHHFTVCGEAERDADNDGIPCENVCGKTLEEYRRFRGPNAPPSVDPVPEQQSPGVNEHGMSPPPPAQSNLQCGGKRKCGQMASCEEARFYLSSCGVRSLDRDGDGVPCESLCGGR